MIELKGLLLQLRKGESIKSINRTSGRHKTVIRSLKAIAEREGWLLQESPVPEEAGLQAAWNAQFSTLVPKPHPLDQLADDFKRWNAEKYSFVVMHRLANERVPCSEATVRRFLHRRFPDLPVPVVPRIAEPGKTLEVDFGYLGLVRDDESSRHRKAWVFSTRLRFSRKAFRKIVLAQDQTTFFVCHIEAFEWLGGVPEAVVPDNLKAAVVKASWTEPLVNRAYRDLAEHYGFAISPCLPATPQHKGGVENDMKYVKRSFWPLCKEHERNLGQEVPRLSVARRMLGEWNASVAEVRTIARLGETVTDLFAQEMPALQPLPPSRWDPLSCAIAKVGVDWRIQFQKSFYSVPYRCIGQQVLVTASRQTVRIFHDGQEIAVHTRARHAWQYQIIPEHGPPQAAEYLATCSKGLVRAAYSVGPHVGRMADAILEDRAVDGIRPLRALVGLQHHYALPDIDRICKRLLQYGIASYSSVKNELVRDRELSDTPRPVFRFAREPSYYREAING